MWGDTVYRYASALLSASIPCLFLATNGAHFQDPRSRWFALRDRFMTRLASRYVNLVVAKPDHPFLVVRDVGKAESDFALAQLFTVGVPNIAVTTAEPTPDASVVKALNVYHYVLTPTCEDATALMKRGVANVVYCPPEGGCVQSWVNLALAELD